MAEHQEAALLAVTDNGLYHKITDQPFLKGMNFQRKKPFDCFRLSGIDAYVVVMFWEPRKKKNVYYILIKNWVKMRDESDRKSMTEEMAMGRASLVGDYTNLLGAGLGVKHKFNRSPFTIFADAGYFMPFHNLMGDELKAVPGDFGDRCDIFLNEKYAAIFGRHEFDYYTMNMSGNMGASFGVKYNINGWTVGLAYRLLEIPLRVNGYSYTDETDRWERYEDQKLSGPMFSVGYEW